MQDPKTKRCIASDLVNNFPPLAFWRQTETAFFPSFVTDRCSLGDVFGGDSYPACQWVGYPLFIVTPLLISLFGIKFIPYFGLNSWTLSPGEIATSVPIQEESLSNNRSLSLSRIRSHPGALYWRRDDSESWVRNHDSLV